MISLVRRSLRWGERLHVFPPIQVPVTEFVSERLFESIDQFERLIWLDAPHSKASFWVALELAYARRKQFPVRRFDLTTKRLLTDTEVEEDVPIYISFARADEWRVRQIALWARARRGFDLWYEQQAGGWLELDKPAVERKKAIEAGGFLVAFPTRWSATRGNLGNEVRAALERNRKHVLLAWLDDPKDLSIPGVELPPEQQIFLRPAGDVYSSIALEPGEWPSEEQIRSGVALPVLARDLDDLIVRIQWLWGQRT